MPTSNRKTSSAKTPLLALVISKTVTKSDAAKIIFSYYPVTAVPVPAAALTNDHRSHLRRLQPRERATNGSQRFIVHRNARSHGCNVTGRGHIRMRGLGLARTRSTRVCPLRRIDQSEICFPIILDSSSFNLLLVRRFASACTLCHRAAGAKHTGRVLSSPGVNTTPVCRV